MKKYYQLMILAIPLLFLLVHICSVSAASGVAAYYVGPGETYITANNLDGYVRKITNTTSNTLFIPVRTLAEQQSFLNNLPSGVSYVTGLSWPGSTHFDVDCFQLGGSIFDTGSGTICRAPSSVVPTGWTQAANWQRYDPYEWGGDDCGGSKSGTGFSYFANAQVTTISPFGSQYPVTQWCPSGETDPCSCTSTGWISYSAQYGMWTVSSRTYSYGNPTNRRVEVGIY